jgi:hypothetical protein
MYLFVLLQSKLDKSLPRHFAEQSHSPFELYLRFSKTRILQVRLRVPWPAPPCIPYKCAIKPFGGWVIFCFEFADDKYDRSSVYQESLITGSPHENSSGI